MSRSIRRMVAAVSVALFVVQAGDGVMAAVCPPEEHLEFHELAAEDASGESSQDAGGPDAAEHPHDQDHDHGDEGHCCPAASSNASACTGAVAHMDDGVNGLAPAAPQDTGPRLDHDLPSDPSLSGTFRPPCA